MCHRFTMTPTNTAVVQILLLLVKSHSVSTGFICPRISYLESSVQLICTGGNGSVHTYTNPNGDVGVAQCVLIPGRPCTPANAPASVINITHSVFNVVSVQTTDAGTWICDIALIKQENCSVTVAKTPTCSITSKEDSDVLVQYQDLTLTVDVQDYYCSTAHNVSLQTGNVTTLLMEADSVPSVTDNTSSVTLNVTDSHLGKVELVFRCDSSQWTIDCGGVTKLVQKTPTCDITSDKDTETLTLQEEVTLTVHITAYYDIRGSYCSVDSNFALQTGVVKHLLSVSDQGLQPVTFNVTETHLGGVRLVFNCQDKHWNLTCDGVTQLNNKIKPRDEVATAVIIASVAGSLVLIVVVIIIIAFVVKRKVNRIKQRSSVKPCSPPYITVGEPLSAAYATVEVNNSIPPASGPGGSQKVVVIDAGGYACAGDVITNAENTSRAPLRNESDELSATSANRRKKEIGVIVQKIVPQDDQTCVNELYASVKKSKDTTLESDDSAV